jgi:hypothetical protein
MAEETYDTTERPEVIRQQMEDTRTSLAEKLETLEQKVSTTVQEATSAVTDTVETVKETVETSVEAVKDTLNLRLQTERHPWEMVGGSFALGVLGGWLTSESAPQPLSPPMSPSQASNGRHAALLRAGTGEPIPHSTSWLSGFSSEIAKLKGLAIGTVAGLLRDAVTEAVPESMRPQVKEVMDDLVTRFGGKPLPSPVLPRTPEEHRASAEPMFKASSPC